MAVGFTTVLLGHHLNYIYGYARCEPRRCLCIVSTYFQSHHLTTILGKLLYILICVRYAILYTPFFYKDKVLRQSVEVTLHF